MSTTSDLKRDHRFQGSGLVNLFRAVSDVFHGKTTPADDSASTGQAVPEFRAVSDIVHGRTAPADDSDPTGQAVSPVRTVDDATKSADVSAPIEVFISYSHKDDALRSKLGTHLSLLKRDRVIDEWHDRRIGAGQEWAGEIDEHLSSAAIILLLVSADFLASDYCYDVEMKRALARHKAREARVIPVILRDVDWAGAPFAHLKALPRDGKPVTSWPRRDKAFADIARRIREVAEELRSARRLAGRDGRTVRLDTTR